MWVIGHGIMHLILNYVYLNFIITILLCSYFICKCLSKVSLPSLFIPTEFTNYYRTKYSFHN